MPSFRVVLLLALVLSLTCSVAASVRAQVWTRSAAPILAPYTSIGGAMTYEHGLLWAGYNILRVSTDRGSTWSDSYVGLGAKISSIVFGDSLHGYFATLSSGGGSIYRTSNGGASWIQTRGMPSIQSVACSFDGSVVLASSADGVLMRSTDYGVTWIYNDITAIIPDRFLFDILIRPDGTVYMLSGFGKRGAMLVSPDLGVTWSSATQINGDSWSLATDSCGARTIYVVNEDYYARNNPGSTLYATTDDGTTWTRPLAFPGPELKGSITAGAGSLTVMTQGGLMQSWDKGRTWKLAPGPTHGADSRTLVTLPDETVVYADSAGYFNSNTPARPYVTVSSHSLFEFDTLSDCSTVEPATVYVSGTSCLHRVVRTELTGADKESYEISTGLTNGMGRDSLSIRFIPTRDGQHTGILTFTLDDGTQIVTRLGGYRTSSPRVLFQTKPSVVNTAIGERLSIPFGLSANALVSDVSFSVAYDPSLLIYRDILLLDGTPLDTISPSYEGHLRVRAPRATTSLSAIVRFDCYPQRTSETMVRFDSLHWTAAIGTCPQQADTALVTTIPLLQGCDIPILSDFLHRGAMPSLTLWPQPATDVITISGLLSNGPAEVMIQDCIGRVVWQETRAQLGAPISIASLPAGVYAIKVVGSSIRPTLFQKVQ